MAHTTHDVTHDYQTARRQRMIANMNRRIDKAEILLDTDDVKFWRIIYILTAITSCAMLAAAWSINITL